MPASTTEATNRDGGEPCAVTGGYEAIVYDLDGTLVRLNVDWAAVKTEVSRVLREAGRETTDADMWSVLATADDAGVRTAVDDIITEHELAGADTAARLPAADDIPRDIPVGVCSLNAEAACRRALAAHELADAVAVVAGRDTTPAMKPDPRALEWVTTELGVAPADTLFVGDSASDETTAERAGADFQWV